MRESLGELAWLLLEDYLRSNEDLQKLSARELLEHVFAEAAEKGRLQMEKAQLKAFQPSRNEMLALRHENEQLKAAMSLLQDPHRLAKIAAEEAHSEWRETLVEYLEWLAGEVGSCGMSPLVKRDWSED
jgi:hypothetical protein